MLASEHLTLIGADLAASVQIPLVADQHDAHILVAMLLDFLKPPCQMREGIPSCDVIDQECARRTSIVASSDRFE